VPDPPFPVAVIPAGTANVLAKELGLPADPVEALRKALVGRTRRVDMGILKGRFERRFLLMAGVGFDAYIVSKVRPALKARIGEAAYLIEVMRRIAGYSYSRFQVITESGSFSATSCIVANTRGYGGGLVFSPDAALSDGLFDLLILEGSSWLGYARFLRSAQRGKPRDFPWVRRCRCRTVRMEGPRGIWVQTDGDLVGTLPVDITIVPSSYPLVVPA
jgi:diacylglycerol kinase family enzyme